MALIQCPECKRLVSEKASACPKCGFQITSEIVKKYKINHPKLGETMNCIACKRVIHKESDFCKYCKQDLSDEGLHKFRIEHPSYFATVKCPTCKKTISELSTQCMYCNTDIQPEEMAALKAHSSKRRSKGCISIISVFFLLVFIMYITEPQKEKHKNEQLASHQVIKKTDEETTVSFKHFVSLMVDEDIKRQELKSLLLHYMNERVVCSNYYLEICSLCICVYRLSKIQERRTMDLVCWNLMSFRILRHVSRLMKSIYLMEH